MPRKTTTTPAKAEEISKDVSQPLMTEAPPAPITGDGQALVPQFDFIVLERIDASPTNPRKSFDPAKLAELTESVRLHGVLQPLVLRPKADRYECVAGERRRRAALAATLAVVPAIVRELTDRQVLDVQLVENGQREDVHPLEEADAIGRLHDEPHRVALEEIAARLGKSLAYVYRRLKLRGLCSEAREAFLEGQLTLGAAEQIARISDPARQAEATKVLTHRDPWQRHTDEPATAGQAADLLRERYMLRLAGARFDLADVTLAPTAGACTSCPKRTAAQREFFEDVEKDDMCLDAACFKAKTDAAWERTVAAAEAKGQKVIDGPAARKLFPYHSDQIAHDAAYIDPRSDCWEGSGGGKKWSTLLGKEGKELPRVVVRAPSGAGVELVDRMAARKILGEKGVLSSAAAKRGSGDSQAAKQRQETQIRKEAATRTIAELVKKVAAVGVLDELLRVMVLEVLEHTYDVPPIVARRRGWLGDDVKKADLSSSGG